MGYVNKAVEANLNFYAPQFTSVGYNTVDIQDIELKDELGMVGYGDSMQIVGPLGSAKDAYFYWGSYMDPTKTVTKDFYWADGEFKPVEKTLNPGDGFAIDNANSMEFDIVIKCPYSLVAQIQALVAAGGLDAVSDYAFASGNLNNGAAVAPATTSGKTITYTGPGAETYTGFIFVQDAKGEFASYTATANITMDNDSTSKLPKATTRSDARHSPRFLV